MAIFAKEAYRSDVSVTTLLALRFTLAAGAFWAIVATRRAGSATRTPTRRVVLVGLALGGIGYAAQSGAFFGALTHIDASLAALLLYTYPALVFAIAIAIGRERADRRRVVALVLATAGAALVLAGGGAGALDPLGVGLALGAAVLYSLYILISDRVVGRIDPFLLGALITTGAAMTLSTAGLATGSLHLGFEPAGWAWIAALGLGSTVVAISAFMTGLDAGRSGDRRHRLDLRARRHRRPRDAVVRRAPGRGAGRRRRHRAHRGAGAGEHEPRSRGAPQPAVPG